MAISAGRHRETEIKIRIEHPGQLEAQLRRWGFVRVHPKALEDNILLDTPDRALRQKRCILRLRRYGKRWTITYKGTPDQDRYFKSRVEFETALDDPGAMRALLGALGFVPVFRYQKYRTEYGLWQGGRRGKPALDVALDETPIGNYMELEGSRRRIDWLARKLGYSRQDYLTASYGALYLEDCARRRKKPQDMVFRSARRRPGRNRGEEIRQRR